MNDLMSLIIKSFNKKSQLTMFVILGVVLLVILFIVLSLKKPVVIDWS